MLIIRDSMGEPIPLQTMRIHGFVASSCFADKTQYASAALIPMTFLMYFVYFSSLCTSQK